ncbi:MAG: thioredoxin fold domain-containing protein [Aureispira sp.]|nr:thioredoxin fold domain-containing protein [Aureispira sp.]
MKKILIALLGVAAIATTIAWTSTTVVKFASSDWDMAKEKAVKESKLYFVDFDASYCATCRNMDQSTYMDPVLAQYMDDNVVALRLDVQDFDGVMWSQQYEVEALPTMLVFNNDGKLVKRLVGYQSASDLLREFKDAHTGTVVNQPNNISIAPAVADEPMPNPNTTTNTNNTNTNNNSYINSFLEPEPPAPSPTGLGLYEIAVRKQDSKGYSVQVGVYSSYETILEQAEDMRKIFKTKTIIHIDEVDGKVVYKLMLGNFESRRDAMLFRRNLREKNKDGLVKDLTMMS